MSRKTSTLKTKKQQKSNATKVTLKKAGNSFQFKLKSGLPVHLIPSARAPVVTVQMWVNTGSADERKPEEGISHFIEHLLFKGTTSFQVGEIAQVVEASGGELNAWTSFDQTVFYVNISKEFSEVALKVISEMMGEPTFDAEEIDREREVVLEEIKRNLDNPARQGSRLLFSTLYRKHPYRLPVIGRPEIIKTVGRKTLTRYFAERYSAKNMHLVIAGDFEPKEMAKSVQAHFSRIPGGKVRKVARPIEALPKKRKTTPVASEAADVKETQIYLSWPMPNAKHADIAGLELISMVFGQGDSSRLVRKLRIESDTVNSVGAGCFVAKDPGFFSVSASCHPEKTEAAIAGICEQIKELRRCPPTEEEIVRAITNTECSEFYGLETAEGLAKKTGSLVTLLGSEKEFDRHMERVRKFTAKEAVRLIGKYLSDDKLKVAILVPQTSKDSLDNQKLSATVSAKLSSNETSAKAQKPEPAKKRQVLKWRPKPDSNVTLNEKTLSCGLRILTRKTESAPVISARIGFLGGARLDQAEQLGRTELLSRTWATGTKDLVETELHKKIEDLAAGLSAFGGRHTVGISGQVLSHHEKDFAQLFSDVLFEPQIDENAIEREKAMMNEALRVRDDRPSQVASRLFMETLFKGHPYAHDALGEPATIQNLNREKIELSLQQNLVLKNGVFVLTGDFNLDLWVRALESKIKSIEGLAKRENSFYKTVPANLAQSEKVFKELKKEQTQVMLGWRGITLDDDRRFAMQVAQAVLAGQGGRLFIELRDKRSLAYSVGPMNLEGVDSGFFGAFIGCAPEKASESIERMNEQVMRLANEEISDVELARAKRYLIGSHDLGLQRASSVSSALLFSEIYGISPQEVFNYSERIKTVTQSEVRKLIAELTQKPSVTVAVGKTQPW